MARDKDPHLMREIMLLKRQLDHTRFSRDHYKALMEERTKQLQRKSKECRQLRRQLRQFPLLEDGTPLESSG
jgi:hypothetical protein